MRFSQELLSRCWFLAGPTACGKSEIALRLADRLWAERRMAIEIVSLDSMTLYRRMDIGTAKPTATERARIPHHLIDLLEPSQDFNVADYLQAAEQACHAIVERGGQPLFVGGTGLYLRSLLRGVFAGPPADATLRQQLEAEAKCEGVAALFQRLRRLDPEAVGRIHENDLRRIVRALEVIELTGQPMSAQLQEAPLPLEQRPRNVLWISPPREWLYSRINARVDAMMAAGWLEEVRRLLQETPPMSQTARQALGYKELIEHLQGERSLPETITSIQARTRQFAKRQHTWFRNLEECRPLTISSDETPEQIADRYLDALR
jgi:tRNA dimethylallyltransferase